MKSERVGKGREEQRPQIKLGRMPKVPQKKVEGLGAEKIPREEVAGKGSKKWADGVKTRESGFQKPQKGYGGG